MRRGFKTQAERTAAEFRGRLGCRADESISIEALAADLGVELVPAGDLVPTQRFEELNELQDDAFSAVTFRLPSGRRVVVSNPLHTPGRTRSNQSHELAHIILQHSLRTVEQLGGFTFLTCDVEQEEEADWLAGCLLLPRDLLYQEARRGRTPIEIAKLHVTSETMARFRLNASGVLIQIGRANAIKAKRRPSK
jgi:Zn-dependent peptidase ImmA (M78 family)